MAFNVRIFGYRGLTQMREPISRHYHADSVHMLIEPYDWGQTLVSDGANRVASAADTTFPRVTVLKVEVPDGEGIRYEIRPTSQHRIVTVDSPRLQGIDYFSFGPGWTFEFIDLAAAP